MHPGPINRGVEIDSEIADSAQSPILERVTNGIAGRMAALFLVNGGKGSQEIVGNQKGFVVQSQSSTMSPTRIV